MEPSAEATPPTDLPPEAPAETGELSDAELEREMQRRLRALNETLDDLLSIPETPAAFAIGTTGEAVARPGTLRDAALEVVSLYDADGDLKPGFSGEFAPFRILNEDATVDEWLKNANLGRHILDSVRLSLATAKDPAGTGDDAPVWFHSGFGCRSSTTATIGATASSSRRCARRYERVSRTRSKRAAEAFSKAPGSRQSRPATPAPPPVGNGPAPSALKRVSARS